MLDIKHCTVPEIKHYVYMGAPRLKREARPIHIYIYISVALLAQATSAAQINHLLTTRRLFAMLCALDTSGVKAVYVPIGTEVWAEWSTDPTYPKWYRHTSGIDEADMFFPNYIKVNTTGELRALWIPAGVVAWCGWKSSVWVCTAGEPWQRYTPWQLGWS